MPHPDIQRATPDDLDTLLELIQEFYRIDHHDYDRRRVQEALPALLESDEHGVVWKVSSPMTGYAVVTWGYSLESGGREALVDELYLQVRGTGAGTHLLHHIIEDCRARGVVRVFLETESHNERGRAFYSRIGFVEDDSIWMSLWL